MRRKFTKIWMRGNLLIYLMMIAVETPIPSWTFHQKKNWFFYLEIVFGTISLDLSTAIRVLLEKLSFSRLILKMLMGFLLGYRILNLFLTRRLLDEFTKCRTRLTKIIILSWTTSMLISVMPRFASQNAPAYGNQLLNLAFTKFPSQRH